MRRDNNPCLECPESAAGCGRHSECDRYIQFYQQSRDRDEVRRQVAILNNYTKNAIQKQKAGTHSTANRYRPRGRW